MDTATLTTPRQGVIIEPWACRGMALGDRDVLLRWLRSAPPELVIEKCWFRDELVDDLELLNEGKLARGQGLAEYALILALVAVMVIAAVTFLGSQINDILSQIGAAV